MIPLPDGVRSRFVDNGNGLLTHVLEAGFDPPGRPGILLLHGFPELAFSWRKTLVPLAEAGFHVAAPDQRGYGLTSGWTAGFGADLSAYRMTSLARDALGLVRALGWTEVRAVVGHDFGSPLAAWCALIRPDVFRAVAMMSAPFAGPPSLFAGAPARDVHADLAALPRPRKHYQWYYSTPAADADMRDPPQGLAAFLRAYYHCKSADWPGNRPRRLRDWSAQALAELPTYYVMDLGATMPETVAAMAPSAAEAEACAWLTPAELDVYVESFARTGFQGGLDWYRCATDPAIAGALALYDGRRIEVPALFVAGAADWGVHQVPGAYDAMAERATADLRGRVLIEGAGHWVQQERPRETAEALLSFLREA